MTGKPQKLAPDEKERVRKENFAKRDRYERKNIGNFEIIYPCEENLQSQYENFMESSSHLWDEFLTGKKPAKKPTAKKDDKNLTAPVLGN